MVAITTRAGKGAPLTNAELDANFSELGNGLAQKLEASHLKTVNGVSLVGSGDITISGGSGTVTSVSLEMPPSMFSMRGSPVSIAGTLAADLVPQPARFVFAAPVDGVNGTPTFRALTAQDIPTLNQSTTGNAASADYATGANYANTAGSANTANTTSGLSLGSLAVTLDNMSPGSHTGKALVVTSSGPSSSSMGLVSVVHQITSTDGSVTISETTPGVFNLHANSGGGGPTVPSWYVINTGADGNLGSTIALPPSFTTTPSGSGVLVVAGNLSGVMFSPPAMNYGSFGGMGGNLYYQIDSYWGVDSNPLAITSGGAPYDGYAFAYIQYPAASTKTIYNDSFGGYSAWSVNYGSFAALSSWNPGTPAIFKAVLIIQGGDHTASMMSPMGSMVTFAAKYLPTEYATIVFVESSDATTVSNILSNSNYLDWGSPQSYCGHAWIEY